MLSGYVHGIVIRAFDHAEVEELARWATVPVINALTDRYHPCQVLADLFTLFEAGLLKTGLRVAFIGDGSNNMVHSWINAAQLFELHLVIACPPAYRPDPAIVAAAGPAVTVLEDPKQAAAGADVLYTDVWVSMGQEEGKAAREKAFRGYQINADLIARAKPEVRIMHCLPAHRGEEITEEALEGPHSLVWVQSENRLHLQKAILERLLGSFPMNEQPSSPSRAEEIPLEAVPIVCEGITLKNLSLDAREGFLLSRLDGHTNVKQLCALSGLGQEETLALLRQLQAKQVVIWHLAKAPKPPAAEPRPKPAPIARGRPGSEEEFAALVDDLFRQQEYLTLYELLGVDSNATSKAVKKAYLQRSKSFHPDRYFRRGDPEFREKLQEIFKRINLAYKELSDPVRRGEYDAELRKQDAGKSRLDLTWEEKKAEPEPPPKPQGPKLKLEFKSALERQMEAKLKEMKKNPDGQGRFAQAARFYQGALAEIGKKNLKAAGINLKLALQYDPHNPTYRAEIERLKELESSMQADIDL